MLKFIAKRILLIIPTMIAVILIVYTIMELTPGTPGRSILGIKASPEAVRQFNAEHGYDKPFVTRFVKYCTGILRGDFGESYRTGKPVFKEIFARFPTTLNLAVMSMIASAVIGIPLGVLSAVKQYSLLDNFCTTVALLMAAIPTFWVGMMLMLVFAMKLHWFPASGVGSWKNFVMPQIALALNCAASIMRLTRTTMLETVRQDYIRTARSKGAPERSIIWNHELRNSLLPVITSLGTNFGQSLGGAVIVESVFAMPGIGLLIVNSINAKDVPVVMASVIFLAALFCVIMLVVDLIYGFIDPRVKAKYLK